jgi:predicted PurR-regulated permease PerM
VTEPSSSSPSWSAPTKALVGIVGLGLLAFLIVRFRTVIQLLIVAAIIAFLIVPLVRALNRHARLSWLLAANLCFLLLVLLLITASTATGLAVIQQLQALSFTVQRFLSTIPGQVAALSSQPFMIGPWLVDLSKFDLAPLANQALSATQPALGQVSTLLASLASVAIESVARLIFILAVAYFLILDYQRLRCAWLAFSIPGYQQDVRRLREALGHIWDSFLRGQLLVVAISGVLTGVLMTVLGVRFSLGLGVLGGVAKFVPILGPTTAGAVAALVALFQPGNWLGLAPIGHAAVVIAGVIVLDQSIDYLLIPRIMGSSLNLHPVIILVGAILGASLAGVLGLLLSAPAMASLLLMVRYVNRKMLDLSPWDPPIDAGPEDQVEWKLWPQWLNPLGRKKHDVE